jgi:hypothetical protein
MTQPGRQPFVRVVMVALALSLSGCAAEGRFSRAGICEAAGGTYTGMGCSSPDRRAEEEMCERSGGVYLAGQDVCAFGAGGP